MQPAWELYKKLYEVEKNKNQVLEEMLAKALAVIKQKGAQK